MPIPECNNENGSIFSNRALIYIILAKNRKADQCVFIKIFLNQLCAKCWASLLWRELEGVFVHEHNYVS